MTEDVDDIYIQVSVLRDGKPHGTTKVKLQDYPEMFKGHGRHSNPTRILVYGRPGIGKSTFTQKIAVDWARGEKKILKKFDVLLLINLRDVTDSQDFPTMLKTAELLSADDPMAFHRLDKYVRENQEKVLLVLDGYDEYSGARSSLVDKIWRGSLLRGCCVVITTRRVKEQQLRKLSQVQFELNGFDSEEQVKEFASKFLSDQKDVEELVGYLRKHDLWDIAEIPLLLLMLCLVWKNKALKGLPTSRANLFDCFIKTLLDHLIAKDSAMVHHSIDEYREQFPKLGEHAFDALLKGLLYFNSSEIPDGVDLKKFIDSGVLQTSKSVSSTPEENVYFLHKYFQEFFAAQFIVDELTRNENQASTCLSEVDSFDTMEEMVEVLKFACELSSHAACAVLKHLKKIGEEEGLTANKFSESPRPKDLSRDDQAFISICTDCLFCCAASDRQALLPLFLECVHGVVILKPKQVSIAAREHLLRSTSGVAPEYVFFDYLEQDDAKIIDEDIFSVMCDLNTVVVSPSSREVWSVKKCGSLLVMNFLLKKVGKHMLLCLNSMYQDAFRALPTELLTELTSAPMSTPQKSVDGQSKNQDNVPGQTGHHCLSFVGKIAMQLATSDDITVVNNVLPFITRPKKIKIVGNPSAGLISNIRFTDRLHSLTLSDISLTAKCGTEIAESLKHAPNLHKLDLSRNPLYGSVSDLAENLHHVPELTELKLGKVQMGEEECNVLARSLNSVNKLRVLEIECNPLGHGIMTLAQHLNCNLFVHHLHHI